ncbi:MAG: GNAT family N-acetyltransferase [Sporichthyaceae bacterium]|nr:GNAT family N-acetyltransferase [Sporichthyaceae bacterium]
MSQQAPATVTVSHHDGSEALAVADSLIVPIYQASHLDVLDNPFYSAQRFIDRLHGYATAPGFDMVIARAGDQPVGLAFGYTLGSNSRWWNGLTTPVPAGFTAENGTRTFAFNELMVRPDWQRRGVARQLHDQLLSTRAEQRATLLVRADNRPAQAAYASWGWRPVGSLQPFPDSPVYDALVRPLPITPRGSA